LRVPGFILAFIAASIVGTVLSLPGELVVAVGWTSKALLVCALFFIGSQIDRETLKSLRGAALIHALVLWLLVVPITLGLVLYVV
jgi:uncharacterized membrane protein YadS